MFNKLAIFGFLVRKVLIVFVVIPATAACILFMTFCGFDFKKSSNAFYRYVSEVSQVPAESPNHVNVITCAATNDNRLLETAGNSTIEQLKNHKPIECDAKLASVTVEKASVETASLLRSIYWLLVVIGGMGNMFFSSPSYWNLRGKLINWVDSGLRNLAAKLKFSKVL